MASKTKVNLRELMKKQRNESKVSSKRIDSPIAKPSSVYEYLNTAPNQSWIAGPRLTQMGYNSLGQLWCVVCNTQVKSEIVWHAHIQGRKHKDNVAALKKPKSAPVKPPPEPVLPKPPPSQPKSILKRRPDDPSVFPLVKKKAKVKEKEADVVSSTSGLPADFFDNSSSKSQSTSNKAESEQPSIPTNNASNSNLPADFFDASVSSSTTVPPSEKTNTEKAASTSDKDNTESNKSNMAKVLPEGFFDDPVIDAKVRNVEVKNTMEEEWSKFQKEMETQQQVSENLQVEDEEEAQIERNIDEIDEQINCFAKVEALRDKQDAIKDIKAKKSQEMTNRDSDDSNSGADEAEFDEFLDWRSKGAWK